MFKAFVLVRNLPTFAESLDFGEFTSPVGPRFRDFRELFSFAVVNRDDWILEKSYPQRTAGAPGDPIDSIPNDIEYVLLLLRQDDFSFPAASSSLIQSGTRLIESWIMPRRSKH